MQNLGLTCNVLLSLFTLVSFIYFLYVFARYRPFEAKIYAVVYIFVEVTITYFFLANLVLYLTGLSPVRPQGGVEDNNIISILA